MYVCLYTGLEIGGIALPKENHFWGNCKSLWQSDVPNFFDTVNHFFPISNHFLNGFAKRPLFGLQPFFRQNFLFFKKIYV